jgi:hypothetical protein
MVDHITFNDIAKPSKLHKPTVIFRSLSIWVINVFISGIIHKTRQPELGINHPLLPNAEGVNAYNFIIISPL